MKVLNICFWDHANFAYDNMMSLRSVGVDCDGVKIEHHEFGYESQLRVTDKTELVEMASQADVIQIFHSSRVCLNLVKHLKKKIIVYHCSSDYRVNPQAMNALFNPHVYRSVLCLTEFWGLRAKNPVYMFGGIDCSNMPEITTNYPVVFGHYPSHPSKKGTLEIVKACKEAGVKLKCDVKKVTYQEQLKRMSGCDVYIELFKPMLHGKPYGSFGITALEAARMGKVVISQCNNYQIYERAYKESAIAYMKDMDHLIKYIRNVSRMPKDHVTLLQRNCQQWVKNNHSYEATGKYWLKNVV